MTIDDLIAEMPKDGWRLDELGRLRRGECCPITCGLRGLPPVGAWMAYEVLLELGLSRGDANEIATAADFSSHCDNALRARLLAAVGLKEPT